MNKTVYMLDDNIAEIEIARYKLHGGEMCGFFGTTQHNEFFNWCSDVLPDVFVIDLMMPLFNGYDIIKKLYELFPGIKKSKIILLTGFKEPLTLKRIQKNYKIDIIDKDSKSCYEKILNLVLNEEKKMARA